MLSRTASLVALFAVVVLICASSARAAYVESGAWTIPTVSNDIAVGNDSSVYTARTQNPSTFGAGEIAKWTATGAAGTPASIATGYFHGIAVDPVSGNIFGYSTLDGMLTFQPDGAPVGSPFPVDVSTNARIGTDTAGNIYFPNKVDKTVEKLSPAGALLDTLGPNPGGVPFNAPLDAAVDSAGNVYVADPAVTVSEVQSVLRGVPGDVATGGTYRLCKDAAMTQCTTNIAFNGSGAAVKGPLEAMLGPGSVVTIAGNTFAARTVTFQGNLAGSDLDDLVCDGSNLTYEGTPPTPRCTVTETTKGSISAPGRIVKFDSNGDFVSNLVTGPRYTALSVDFDREADRLFAIDGADGLGDGRVTKYSAAGMQVDQFGAGAVNAGDVFSAVAVNSGSGAVYTSGNVGAQARIWSLVPAPTTVTGSASSVTKTGATLSGTVNPNGQVVTACEFEYGTTTAYGQTASCVPDATTIGSGSSPVGVSANVTGLDPDTEYHFRLTASNAAAGEEEGDDATFETLAPLPPDPATLAATSVGSTAATLNGEVDLQGETATDCRFEWGVGSAFDREIDCASLPAGVGDVPVSADLTGLAPSTGYEYRLVVTTAGGTETASSVSFTTDAAVAPTVATGSASAVSQTTATLNGMVNPNGDAVTSCRIEYGTTTAYGSTAPCTPAPGAGSVGIAVSANVAGLVASTTYHFRVVAANAGGTTNGDDSTFATPAHTCATDALLCPPPPVPPIEPPVAGKLASAAKTASYKSGKAAFKLKCAGGRCKAGKVTLKARIKSGKRKAKVVAIGSVSVKAVAAGRTVKVKVKLNGKAKGVLAKTGKLAATLSGAATGKVTIRGGRKRRA